MIQNIDKEEWSGFKEGNWCTHIDVRDFIQKNYTEYTGNDSFLVGASDKTKKLLNKVEELMKEETKKGGVLDADTNIVSTIISHEAGYIDKDLEEIVGLQTDRPLKRAIMPAGGVRMVKQALEENGYTLDSNIEKIYSEYRKSHNQGVYDAYTNDMRKCRKNGIITGLPDAYGRGRIIGDYRRIALYGVDVLINDKEEIKLSLEVQDMSEDVIRNREEITEQINALVELKEMALKYGYDISYPAKNTKQAIQWTYFGYLAAIKQQNGAAMSLGRTSTFLDIYIKRDLDNNYITEEQAQELMDHFIIKLRMVRFLRTKAYSALFAGDPNWVTESIGGVSVSGDSLVTKNSFRVLQTLFNLGSAPEPNLTVLWSENLPDGFKDFACKVSIKTSSIQFENDDIMRQYYGDDYAIACCVSPMRVGKQMQFFGARCNLAKALLYAINGGRDEITGMQVAPKLEKLEGEYLDYDQVMKNYDEILNWVAKEYVNTLNVIHYMHDKYSYESLQMSLHDKDIYRTMAFGVSGLSVVADSFSAIKYAMVKPIRNEEGIAIDFEIEGEFPCYGNDDDRVDNIALKVQKMFMEKLKSHKTYRNSDPTMSILTITSNVAYGKKTGTTPDGRKAGVPFAPGANPMYQREKSGMIAALNSVAKLDFDESRDGISNTFSIVPSAIGKTLEEKVSNLKAMLDSYFENGGQHININVYDREVLIDAMNNPEKYPNLTIRVSGYAVKFVKLDKEHQLDVIARTFHEN